MLEIQKLLGDGTEVRPELDVSRNPDLFVGAKPHLPPKGGWTKKQMVRVAKKALEELGWPLTCYGFLAYAGIRSPTLYRVYPRGFHDLLDDAGIEPAKPGLPVKWSDDQLLADYGRIAEELGRYPTVVELDQMAEASQATYRLRIGRKGQIIKRYEEWVAARTAESDPVTNLSGE